jgi:hypothetical protein
MHQIIFNVDSLDYNKILKSEVLWAKLRYEENSLKKRYLLLKFFFRSVFRSLLFSPKITYLKQNTKLFIRSFSRFDLDKHANYFDKIKGTTNIVLDQQEFKLDILIFFKTIYLLFISKKNWTQILNKHHLSICSCVFIDIVIRIYLAFSNTQKILPILSRHKKVISFFEYTPFENIICQISNMNNIETFALEHALQFPQISGKELTTIETIGWSAYESSVCMNILCWGEYSMNNYKKFIKSKIYVIGKASLPEIHNVTNGITFVLGNNDLWKNINEKLIILSKKLKSSGVPTNLRFKTNKLQANNFKSIIIGTSSNLLIELGYLGFKVYILKDRSSLLCEQLPSNLIVNDFKDIYFKFKNQKNYIYPHDIWKKYIKYSGNETLLKYKEIIF